AEHGLHAFEQRADAAPAAIGHGRIVCRVERKLVVLGADAPLRARLAAGGDVVDELVAALYRPGIGRVAGHSVGVLPAARAAWLRGRCTISQGRFKSKILT